MIRGITVHGVYLHHRAPLRGVVHVGWIPSERLHGFGRIERSDPDRAEFLRVIEPRGR